MAITVVTGPPMSGKSQKVKKAAQAGELILDTSDMWKTMYRPGEGWVRPVDDARVVRTAMMAAAQKAAELKQDGYLIVAERDPEKLQRWMRAVGAKKARLVTEPWNVLRDRAYGRGPDCEELLSYWEGYQDDAELAQITELWEGEERGGFEMEEALKQYRAAAEAVTRTECGERVQVRCLTEDAELRAEDEGEGGGRTVTGIAVRYGDEARIGGMNERIARGALELPKSAANLTVQHDRALPVALLEWDDKEDALRFRATFPEGMRQDQALADVRSGLLRGASLEFVIEKESQDPPSQERPGEHPTFVIERARVLRLSLVDDPAYPRSAVEVRTSCGCASKSDAAADDAEPEPPVQVMDAKAIRDAVTDTIEASVRKAVEEALEQRSAAVPVEPEPPKPFYV